MKTLKFILAVSAVAIVAFFVWRWLVPIKDPTAIRPDTNQFVDTIEQEIDLLREARTDVFCKEFYKEIQYRIDDFYKNGFLGNTQKDNTQWQEILSANLYSVYAPKFADQAFYVFNGSDWNTDDLSFIRKEVSELQKSAYLERNSRVDNSCKNIQVILSKYGEIEGFIYSCNTFSFSIYDIETSFPVSDVSSRIQKSKNYLNNQLDNHYVNNCIRLKDGLHNIPQTLFNKHINYLRSKIQQNMHRFTEYEGQPAYSTAVYEPLNSQLGELDNDIYGISSDIFESSSTSLQNMLDADNSNAVDYFTNH